MIWNERIKQLRSNTDYTLKDISSKIGVSEATAQRYESNNGISNIPYDIIVKYANLFDVSPGYIMGWEASDEMPLSSHERRIISSYRASDQLTKDMVNRILNLDEPAQQDKMA